VRPGSQASEDDGLGQPYNALDGQQSQTHSADGRSEIPGPGDGSSQSAHGGPARRADGHPRDVERRRSAVGGYEIDFGGKLITRTQGRIVASLAVLGSVNLETEAAAICKVKIGTLWARGQAHRPYNGGGRVLAWSHRQTWRAAPRRGRTMSRPSDWPGVR